jgi:murein DD-endopeptidase MepM/ murein hydrolase activator NlpD
VFEGTVGFVASVPGVDGKIISIMHGEYYTVYCNLKNIAVNTGDKVKIHQVLGEVFTDKEGVSTLQFQVWHNNERMNPENWLKR